MFKSYLQAALRSLLKNKIFSFIHVFGLALSLSAILVIFIFTLDEYSFDKFHNKSDRIYRITRDFWENGAVRLHLATVPAPVGERIAAEFPEIEAVVRLRKEKSQFILDGHSFQEDDVYFAEPSLFDIFDISLKQGESSTALQDPFTLVLSEEMAQKYFPKQNPVGKTLFYKKGDQKFSMRVSGVFQSLPANAHFHPKYFISFSTLENPKIYKNSGNPKLWGKAGLQKNWGANSFLTYILCKKDKDIQNLEAGLDPFMDKHFASFAISEGWWKASDEVKASHFSHLYLQKLEDIHLHSQLDMEAEANGNVLYVYVFTLIAIFVLIVAVLNFIILSTVQSAKRAREIGVRKVLGASRKNLMFQFLTESMLLVLSSAILALGIVELILPTLNTFLNKELSLAILFLPSRIVIAFLLVCIIGILAGVYPAWFLSRYQAVSIMKGRFFRHSPKVGFNKFLVISQFTIAICLMIGTALVFRQVSFIQNKTLGFNKNQIITLGYPGELNENYASFYQELLQNPNIQEVGRSSHLPSTQLLSEAQIRISDIRTGEPKSILVKDLGIDQHFIPTYQVPILAGRNFEPQYRSDTESSFLINEKAIQLLGYDQPEEILNQSLESQGRKGKIIGVVKNFHFESLREEIKPMIFTLRSGPEGYYHLAIKLNTQAAQASLAHIHKTWEAFVPASPFVYAFLDENFARLYEAEGRLSTLLLIFTSLAIGIACLGLFGLAFFLTQQRIQEIGIRKVLGAGMRSLFLLLSLDYFRLLMVASLIAVPITTYAVQKWLENFAYHLNLAQEWYIFLGASMFTGLLVLISISSQILKVAFVNPIEVLRND